MPRGTSATNYQIVIHKCESCLEAVVETQRGAKRIRRKQLEAAECDAVITRIGKPNRSTIPPSVRQAVFTRDRYRCSAPGCQNTRFLEIHHIVSRKKGGDNHPDNLHLLCSACHRLWHEKNL